MDLYIKLFDVLFPVFFVIGVGYYLGVKDPKFNTKFITNFAGNIGTPAMIFYTITTTGVTLAIFIEYFFYALIIIGGFSIMDVRNEPLLYLSNRIFKRLTDIIISLLSILFVLTWLPLIVKIFQSFTYPGPLFFVQDRIGRNGNKSYTEANRLS